MAALAAPSALKSGLQGCEKQNPIFLHEARATDPCPVVLSGKDVDGRWEIGGGEGRQNEIHFYIGKNPSREVVLPANAFARSLYLACIARIGPGGKKTFSYPRRACQNSCISLRILHIS